MSNVSVKNIFSAQIVLDFLKGIIVALLVSLALIIGFAFSLKWFEINDNYIPAITLLIKGISVFIGAMIAVSGDSKGLLKGLAFGAIYIFLAFLIFSVLSGEFGLSAHFVLDLLSASLLSGIVGIVKVNRNSKI